jgi:hypothetical protein
MENLKRKMETSDMRWGGCSSPYNMFKITKTSWWKIKI